VRPDNCAGKPGAPNFRIQTLTAFIAIDPGDNSEGVVSKMDPVTGLHEPLIGADEERIRCQRPYAEQVAKAAGIEVKLVRFGQREELEVIAP
jgi:hypothetical protein